MLSRAYHDIPAAVETYEIFDEIRRYVMGIAGVLESKLLGPLEYCWPNSMALII